MQRENQFVDVAGLVPRRLICSSLNPAGFFSALTPVAAQRRHHLVDFIAILLKGLKRSNFISRFQLFCGLIHLIVSQFRERTRFANRVGLMLVSGQTFR